MTGDVFVRIMAAQQAIDGWFEGAQSHICEYSSSIVEDVRKLHKDVVAVALVLGAKPPVLPSWCEPFVELDL